MLLAPARLSRRSWAMRWNLGGSSSRTTREAYRTSTYERQDRCQKKPPSGGFFHTRLRLRTSLGLAGFSRLCREELDRFLERDGRNHALVRQGGVDLAVFHVRAIPTRVERN